MLKGLSRSRNHIQHVYCLNLYSITNKYVLLQGKPQLSAIPGIFYVFCEMSMDIVSLRTLFCKKISFQNDFIIIYF